MTLKDGGERAAGLGCELRYAQSGGFDGYASECHPATLTDWQDGAVPPSFPPGTVFG